MYSDDNKEVDMVELGTKIIGNFGAMIPLSFGKVVTIETFDVGPVIQISRLFGTMVPTLGCWRARSTMPLVS